MGTSYIFFQKLFLGISKESFIKKRDLKEVKHNVKKCRPAIFLFGTNRVSGHFGQMLLELAGRVSIFKQVFEICDKENRPGPESPGSFVEFFVRQFIEDITELQKTFSYSYILEERHIFREDRIRKTVENVIDKLLSSISHELRQKINYLYTNLLGIERLSEYNFYSVLRKFGEGYSAFNNSMPLFGNVSAYEVRFDLKKLENLIFSIDLTVNIETPLEIMINFYKNITSDENLENIHNFADNDIEKMIDSILTLTHEEKLTNLIRLSSGNPYHVPTIKIRQVNIIDKFRIQLIKKYIPHCQTILHQIEMDELKRQIDELFGNTPLSSLEFYNETTNKRLINFDLPVFSNCRYLQILKTYTERLFNSVIKPSLNIIVVDGNFLDNTLYKKLSNFFYNYSENFEKIIEFERKVSTSNKDGEQIQDLFNNYEGSLPGKKKIGDKIHFLNHLSAVIIKDFAELFYEAIPALKAIVDDSNYSKKPFFISNIKKLGGMKNNFIIDSVKKAAKSTETIYEMIKGFIK